VCCIAELPLPLLLLGVCVQMEGHVKRSQGDADRLVHALELATAAAADSGVADANKRAVADASTVRPRAIHPPVHVHCCVHAGRTHAILLPPESKLAMLLTP
jgi:hypothetical protein